MNYKAFGMIIDSEFRIPQAIVCGEGSPDVTIRRSDLRDRFREDDPEEFYSAAETRFSIPDVGLFRITEGSLIEVEPVKDLTENELSVYLMGSCMGAVFHQRGLLPLHGSCVTDGSHAILITGSSGAGKSTLAAEFLKRGWKLVTDDVCLVKNIETVPMAQSSYPTQKLWNDSFAQYAAGSDSVSLYTRGEREKFGVARSDSFFDGMCPLTMIVRLVPADVPETEVTEIGRIPAIEQVRRNIYRSYMIDASVRNACFQKCVTLSGKVKMVLAVRGTGDAGPESTYEKLTACIHT